MPDDAYFKNSFLESPRIYSVDTLPFFMPIELEIIFQKDVPLSKMVSCIKGLSKIYEDHVRPEGSKLSLANRLALVASRTLNDNLLNAACAVIAEGKEGVDMMLRRSEDDEEVVFEDLARCIRKQYKP